MDYYAFSLNSVGIYAQNLEPLYTAQRFTINVEHEQDDRRSHLLVSILMSITHTWLPAIFPRPHTVRIITVEEASAYLMYLLQSIRNIVPVLHVQYTVQTRTVRVMVDLRSLLCSLSCQIGYLRIPTVLNFLYTVKS